MVDRGAVEALLHARGYTDYRWMRPSTDIVVSEWVRMKCAFGCDSYGKRSICPPNTPSVADCRRFFGEFETGLVLHFPWQGEKPEDRRPWCRETNMGLLKLERDIFLAGHRKAFLLYIDPCHICAECTPDRADCKNGLKARPTAEGMAVDVFGTVRPLGFPIEVLTEYTQVMNRYSFLLIE